MIDYGLEIFNANDELVYDSRKRTPRVLAMGTHDWRADGQITFEPVAERPQLFAEFGDRFITVLEQTEYIPPEPLYPFPRYRFLYRFYVPAFGPFMKNEEGLYYGVTCTFYRTQRARWFDNADPGVWGYPIGDISYVIFI